MIEKKEQKESGQKVDGYIDHMVTKNIVFPEKVIESKTQTRYWSINSFTAIKTGKKCLFKVLPAEFVKVYWFVFKDINFVIEVPGGMKGV